MRNYEKEKEWAKNKYSRVLADIDKELAENLKAQLKKENKSIASWITENAVKYLDMERTYDIVDLDKQGKVKRFKDSEELLTYLKNNEHIEFLIRKDKDNYIIDFGYAKKELDQ